MEMVVNAFALNMASEEAIAPRQSLVGWLQRKIAGARRIPSHILAITDLAAA